MSIIVRLVVLLLFFAICVCATNAKPNARDYIKRGDTQVGLNNFTNAIRNYTRAIELDPSLAEAYVKRGMGWRVKGGLSGPIRDFEGADEIDPQATINNELIVSAGVSVKDAFNEIAELNERRTD